MLFREHRELLSDSMTTCTEMDNSKDTVIEYIFNTLKDYGYTKHDVFHNTTVSYYCYDDRIGWDTYIVVIKGCGVFGFTNEQVVALQDNSYETTDSTT